MSPTSLVERLIDGLDDIESLSDEFIDASTIDYDENRGLRDGYVAILCLPHGEWGPMDNHLRQIQRRLLEKWKSFWEQIEFLFSGDSTSHQAALNEAAAAVFLWLDRSDRDHSIPATLAKAKDVFRRHASPIRELLRSHAPSNGRIFVVPDTNVVLRNQDVATWEIAVGCSSYTVFLVPGVLGELDDHKVNHRNPEVREKARKFSSRYKGWRQQGNLASGVRVQGDVYVQVEGREPNFKKTLSWLDSEAPDDRIIASVLELQRRFPTTQVVLLTGDTLMLAKADTANIPTADVPEPDL